MESVVPHSKVKRNNQGNVSFDLVEKAFSLQSESFDQIEQGNEILSLMREQVRSHVRPYLKAGDNLLELNSGTGLDAVYFAKLGIHVMATDISSGMIDQIKQKIVAESLGKKVTAIQTSFTNLNLEPGYQCDYIFSNFGGLNCVRNLKDVFDQFPKLLKPNGQVTLVVMPKICPWELAHLFKGNFRFAFRRLKKGGTIAHLEGQYFKTYYHSIKNIQKSLGQQFKPIKIEAMGLFIPPPAKDQFPDRYPRFFSLLKRWDAYFRTHYPFNRWGDHIIVTYQYVPQNA